MQAFKLVLVLILVLVFVLALLLMLVLVLVLILVTMLRTSTLKGNAQRVSTDIPPPRCKDQDVEMTTLTGRRMLRNGR